MGTYVYAIVYDNTGNFAKFVKNTYGYFFSDPKNPGSGQVIPNPSRTLNGAGKFAFPGGGLKFNEDVPTGAIREFYEETKYTLTQQQLTGYFTGEDKDSTYYGVFFKVDNLNDVVSTITTNLSQGQQAATDIQQSKITKYEDIATSYPNCPPDNELASIAVWNIVGNETDISLLMNDTDTNWFYSMLVDLYWKEGFNRLNTNNTNN
jgi:ADP-ribose pyrophosphatase YjhB (NUDIX family)